MVSKRVGLSTVLRRLRRVAEAAARPSSERRAAAHQEGGRDESGHRAGDEDLLKAVSQEARLVGFGGQDEGELAGLSEGETDQDGSPQTSSQQESHDEGDQQGLPQDDGGQVPEDFRAEL